MNAVILAGGKGTRLVPHIGNIPKALVKIGQKTVIEHQLSLLKRYGFKEVWILLGFLGNQVKEHLKNGAKEKIEIHYLQEETPLGTAGALRQLKNDIKEDFLLFSGDIMMNFDIPRFVHWHRLRKESIASLVVHPNDHPFDSDMVEINDTGKIVSLLKRPHPPEKTFRNLSIASVFILSPKIFKYIPAGRKTDFEKDILPVVLETNKKVFGYNTPEYLKDLGTPERLKKVRSDYASGKIKKLCLENKIKAIFLDRDGVISHEVGQLCKLKDLKIYSFVSKAIRKINDSGYLAILITNQPMIAKGFMTQHDLKEIHNKLETELGRDGAKLDAIYYCPHHPEKGFAGEVPELKIKCDCRKPGTGLIMKARNEFNLDLKKSYFVGDQTSDILAGRESGCRTILVKTGYGGKDGAYPAKPDFFVRNLLEAVNVIPEIE